MPLKQRSEQRKYVRIKDGKLYIGKDTETSYDELEGVVTNLYFKDEEYNGAPLRKLILIISDEDDNYQIGLNTESNSYTALISFLPNIDLSRPITLHPMEEVINKDGAEVKKRTILVSQDGKFAKSYFTKDNTHGLPRWESVTVGKKKITDKTLFLDFLENFVSKELVPRITEKVETKSVVNKPVAVLADDSDEEDTKLPWETSDDATPF